MIDDIGVVAEDLDDDDTYHVHPIGDIREHVTSGWPDERCWCSPTIKYDGDALIVIHNSLDGREKYETGERKPH